MPMHPAVESYALFPLLETLFSDARGAALERLVEQGFVAEQARGHWEAELQKPQYNKGIADLLALTKLMVDPKAAAQGKLASKEPLVVLSHLRPLMGAASQLGHDYSLEGIRQRTIMDFGGGIYYPLSTAVVLHANGYRQAISYEPFEIKIDFAVASLFELLRAMFETPARFCFSGIEAQEMKYNLARLDFEGLADKLARLNRHEVDHIDLGGVLLANRRDAVAPASVDTIFSNSVLEHVGDLADELAWHQRILRPNGMCFHTVDFVDHRYYFDNTLNAMEMYYDGVLDEVNGLRPSQMEALFLGAGFACGKYNKLALPAQFVDPQRPMTPAFAALPQHDVFEWVNGYMLRKT